MNLILKYLFITMICFSLSGCASITAIRHPGKKNLEVLARGSSRDNVIAYLGAPISTEKEDSKTIDIYQFRQGFSGGNKATRAVFHLVADFFTFFLWELAAWPTEMIINGEDMTIKVVYDEHRLVEDFLFLKRG